MKKKGILIPAEHGAWGLIAEPLLLGLLAAPSPAGFFLALFSFAAFLLRTPGLRLLRARRAASPDPHGPTVKRFTLVTGSTALLSLLAAIRAGARSDALFPFAAALPPMLWTLREQDRGRTRTLWPELIAGAAVSAPVSAIAIAGGIPARTAYFLWGLLALKNVSAILYVRCQIKRLLNRPHDLGGMITLHAAIPALLLVFDQPAAVTVPFLLLAARATLLSFFPFQGAKQIGWGEVGVSLLFVLSLGLTFP